MIDLNAIVSSPGNAPCIGVEIIQDVPIQEVDGFAQTMHVIRPADTDSSRPEPALVYFHGGGYRIANPWNCGSMAKYLALSLGITTFLPTYRLYDGTGPTFPDPIQDCADALRWIRQNAGKWNIDATRTAVGGQSAGCYLAGMAVLTTHMPELAGGGRIQGEAIQPAAFLAFWGPVDFVTRWHDNGQKAGAEANLLGQDFLENPALYHRSCLIPFIEGELPPALMVYGGQDPVVQPRQGELAAAAWKAANAHAELQIFDNIGHNVVGDNRESKKAYILKTKEFLERHL